MTLHLGIEQYGSSDARQGYLLSHQTLTTSKGLIINTYIQLEMAGLGSCSTTRLKRTVRSDEGETRLTGDALRRGAIVFLL